MSSKPAWATARRPYSTRCEGRWGCTDIRNFGFEPYVVSIETSVDSSPKGKWASDGRGVRTMGQDLYANPLGTDGFEFVEFTSPHPQALGESFEAMGFTAVARHR